MEFTDELWNGGPKLIQSDGVFKLGTDSVLLAHFAEVSKKDRVCDLGCGTGVIAIILTSMSGCACTGIEIQEQSFRLAERNVALNNLGERIDIVLGDIREHRQLLQAGAYDLVISNPPYFAEKSGLVAEKPSMAEAKTEKSCGLEDVIAAAAYLCRWGGRFALVNRPENLARIFSLMVQYKIEPKRLRIVSHRATDAPNLVLIEGRRGGKTGLTIEKPLILCDEDGRDTAEIKKIYHRA